jgi:hypothetical protein
VSASRFCTYAVTPSISLYPYQREESALPGNPVTRHPPLPEKRRLSLLAQVILFASALLISLTTLSLQLGNLTEI